MLKVSNALMMIMAQGRLTIKELNINAKNKKKNKINIRKIRKRIQGTN